MKQFFNTVSFPILMPLRVILFIFAGLPLLFSIILFCTLNSSAITKNHWSINHSDIQKAKELINRSSSNTQESISLNEKDLNLALSYLLNYYTHSASSITVGKDQLHFKISLLLNNHYFGKYLNFSFILTKLQGYPVINSLEIGHIKIADEFAGLILESIIKYTPLKDYYILAARHIRGIQINNQQLTISYFTPENLNLNDKLSLNNQNYQSVIFYQQHLSNIIAHHDPKWRLSLADLLHPLFKLAYQRSTTDTAIAENRAVLIAISSYVNKNEIQAFVPFKLSPETQKDYPASLYRRTDMAKHFMISAVLAATGAETLGHILGQEKELNDAKQGSGFSFIDLAGDRAGLRFGTTAVASPAKARRLQKRMFNIKDYTAFMPEVRDLPENMSHTIFNQQYESIYSAKYQNMLKMIDQRIAQLVIYQ